MTQELFTIVMCSSSLVVSLSYVANPIVEIKNPKFLSNVSIDRRKQINIWEQFEFESYYIFNISHLLRFDPDEKRRNLQVAHTVKQSFLG